MPKGTLHLSRRQGTHPRPITARKSTFHNKWERWPDACKRVFEFVRAWELVRVELTPRLRSNQIRSLVRAVDLRTDKPRDRELPANFWREVTIRAGDELEIGWRRWLSNKRVKNAIPTWWPSADLHRSVHYFFLRRRDVDKYLSAFGKQGAPGQAKNERRRPGPEPMHNWPIEVASELLRRITPREKLPKNELENCSRDVGILFLKMELGAFERCNARPGEGLAETRA